MALLFDTKGKSEKALEFYESTLSFEEANLDKDHPNTLTTLHCISEVYFNMSDFEKAAPLFERAVSGRESKLGAMHQGTLITLWYIALIFKSKGEIAGVVEKFTCGRDGFGEEHEQ